MRNRWLRRRRAISLWLASFAGRLRYSSSYLEILTFGLNPSMAPGNWIFGPPSIPLARFLVSLVSFSSSECLLKNGGQDESIQFAFGHVRGIRPSPVCIWLHLQVT